MNQLCPVKSLCIDPANPVQNFSSEAPDLVQFISINTGWDSGDGGFNTPPIGGTWDSAGCQAICTSTISQADADQCAANQQLSCTDIGGNWNNPPRHPVVNSFNDSETCTSFCPDGLPFNFTVSAGTILAQNRVAADNIAKSFACTQARIHRICQSSINPSEACMGSAYLGVITASGGFLDPALNTWSLVSGALPPGLSFPNTSGPSLVISGTPTQVGSFNFTLRVTAPNGDFMQKQQTLCVLTIEQSTLPNCIAGLAYNTTLSTTSCAHTPVTWVVSSGSLPPGLSLNPNTGVISGTVSTSVLTNFPTFNFTVQATTGP